MRKLLLIAPLLIAVSLIATPASAQNTNQEFSYKRDTAMLFFRTGSGVLYDQYKTNSSELASIMRFVAQNAEQLRNGAAHLNVVAYIPENLVGNVPALNNASLQASVVRAQFKTRYNIPHAAITFSIDTTRNISNCVRVDYVAMPVPAYSNSTIFYSESDTYASQSAQMAKYKPSIPYTNYYMYLCRLDPNYGQGVLAMVPATTSSPSILDRDYATADSLDEALARLSEPQGPVLAVAPKASENIGEETTVVSVLPQTTVAEKPMKTPRDLTKSDHSVFGLKTNLLYWMVGVPNLNFEFYLGQRFSLSVDGAYTWAWFLPTDKAYHFWQAGGEARVWLKGQKQFTGHFFGVHGGAGQYDVKFGNLGQQGDFYSVGLTYGYLLPIGKSFCMEFELGLGYTNYSVNKYEYVNNTHNISVEKVTNQSFFGPTKAAVSLVWKF